MRPNNFKSLSSFFWNLAKAVRIRQWIKNFALFAGIIFSGQLTNPLAIFLTIQAFILFCAASSTIYLLNDVFDIERDRLHPFKSSRPIASGKLSVKFAISLSLVLISVVLPTSYFISPALFLAILAYLILQLFYSAYLKSIILIDVMAIAAGFLLRIYAGVWVIDAHLNVWFLLTVLSFALFLAIGKRRSELTLLQSQAAKHRETLLHYPENFLDILTSMFANSTWLSYAFFTFLQPPISARYRISLIFDNFSLPFTQAKFLMATVPLVIYGVMRYLYIIYEKKEGESPERVLLTDKPLLVTVILWIIMVIGIIYYLGA
ncbi:decaprenyl-phosphate phosphoribosyltransferase, partial [Candidatus Daviesbacteria bacterium]|nr:decaprenyl-phosphate phosphoribosyltransferase [Candidatus Daviesbacteria bacterium]